MVKADKEPLTLKLVKGSPKPSKASNVEVFDWTNRVKVADMELPDNEKPVGIV